MRYHSQVCVLIVFSMLLGACASQNTRFVGASGFMESHRVDFKVKQISRNQIKLDAYARASFNRPISEGDLRKIYNERAAELCHATPLNINVNIERYEYAQNQMYSGGLVMSTNQISLKALGVLTCRNPVSLSKQDLSD